MLKRTFLLFLLAFSLAASAPATETTLLKRTIFVTPQKFLRYWKNPKAAERIYNTNSWYPRIKFDVLGPLDENTRVFVEFDRADGKPWTTIEMDSKTLADDVWETILPKSIDSEREEKLASIEAGNFSFRIKLRPAGDAEKTLFSGNIRVSQQSLDQRIPENRGKKEFVADYDWHLPLGYLWLNPLDDGYVPHLSAQFCLKGKITDESLAAVLYYNGREVVKEPVTTYSVKEVLTSGADETHHRYSIIQVNFMKVRGGNQSENRSDYSGFLFLDKNPGAYEIRLVRDGQLSRTMKFSVGRNGVIEDNNIARNANLGGVRMILPTKIAGTLDGVFNAAAWKTDALFGNPPIGFTVE